MFPNNLDNRNLSLKDRLSLISRAQVMYINGKSEAEIRKFAESFAEPRENGKKCIQKTQLTAVSVGCGTAP